MREKAEGSLGKFYWTLKSCVLLVGSSSGETKEKIAEQLGMGLEILAVCSSIPAEELAALLDTLLTDFVEHNKGVNEVKTILMYLQK